MKNIGVIKKFTITPRSSPLPSLHQNQNQLVVLYQVEKIHPTVCSSLQTRDASPVIFRNKKVLFINYVHSPKHSKKQMITIMHMHDSGLISDEHNNQLTLHECIHKQFKPTGVDSTRANKMLKEESPI